MAHPGGRPLKFKTVKDLQDKADEWFIQTPMNQQTITGLAVYLDTSRETLMNYEKRDEFFDTIKKIKDKIEYSYELSLRTRGSAGDIFGLKNFGWKDKTEVDTNISGQLDTGVQDPKLAADFADFLKQKKD